MLNFFILLEHSKVVLKVLGSLLLVTLVLFSVHKYNSYQQDIGAARVQALWDASEVQATKAREQREEQFLREKDNAITQAVKNTQASVVAGHAASMSSGVFSSTLQAVLDRSLNDTLEANRKYTTTLATILRECQNEYRQMGQAAQGHANDSLMYQQAWPVTTSE